MFDVGFWEMAFIGVIALVVIGPERLPGVARSVGLWVGKGRHMLNEVMSDVKKEMKEYDDEYGMKKVKTLRDDLKSASTSASKELKDITQSAADSLDLKAVGNEFKKSVDDASDSASDSLRQETSKINPAVKSKAAPGKSIASKTTARKKSMTKKKPAKKNSAARKSPAKKPAKKLAKKTAGNKGRQKDSREMKYYIYENWANQSATIHVGACRFCNNGRGLADGSDPKHAAWHGPFNSLKDARHRQKSMKAKVNKKCGHCVNRSLL
ncbi:Sec-independent protein translocase protein TatB [Candidatus Spongiihabitans sp.]|uniref:Sec-independent protein translocase protein TatB n=1 Tax=Candidatus Spongiihabitans sp. TaxID=3101308 RepID=UPI003C70578F